MTVKGFTAEQTSAFHRIARTVFEASIERGELGLEGAFKTFTDMMLAFAVVPENPGITGTGEHHIARPSPPERVATACFGRNVLVTDLFIHGA